MFKYLLAHSLEEKQRTQDVTLHENVNFDSLLLPEFISKGLSLSGFRKPSPIQFKAIPLGRCGFDLIVKSKSGTGKTLVFSIIALEVINTSKNQVQALILVPTREIAVQIQEILTTVGQSIDGLRVEYFIGGLPLEEDIKKAKNCQIAVGAPGRVKHLITLGALSTKHVKLFVLDEADKLMEISFQSDINEIYNTLPERKQMIASSATYPKELESFLSNYMLSPTHVSSEIETPVLLGLKQFVSIIKTPSANVVQLMKAKNAYLVEVLSKIAFTQCLVFSNYQTRAESISNYLNQKGWNSIFISAAQSQTKRLEAVTNLKEFKNRILLSTDLTSRGIDAPNVDLVINYDIPQDAVTYLHRMGRAGRYGTSGICINLTLEGDELLQLQKILGTIGATNLSISKLPPLSEANLDLWQLDPNTLEQIHPIISTDVAEKLNERIKSEVMALKEHNKITRNKKNRKHKKSEGKVDNNDSHLNGDSLMNIVNKSKRDFDSVEEALDSVDTEILLQSLISSSEDAKINAIVDVKDTNNVISSEDSKELLELVCADSQDVDDDTKKRKRDSSNELNKELHIEKKINDTRSSTFCKNKALLSVTMLLCNPRNQFDVDIVNSIDSYLKIIKQDNFNYSEIADKTVEEILNEDCESLQRSFGNNVKVSKEEFDIENVFSIAYKCAISNEGKSWIDCISREERERFQNICREEEAPVESFEDEDQDESDNDGEGEDYYEEEDYEMEEDSNEDFHLDVDQGIGPWIPVVHENRIEEDNSEHFRQCFEECNNSLWQNGLSFETVGEFDDWYYQWQQQLQAVRNYVQQNIYVEEMSKYQQSRRRDGF